MRLDLFSPGDSVLLLGEGNFSFAVNLLNHHLPIFMVATCFEQEMKVDGQADHIQYLEDNEVPVYLNVLATKIHEHRFIAAHKYSKVVFNFPHIGGKKKNIQEHRDLLREMFKSARQVVRDDGQMLVSLCRGQGGTEFDLPYKRYEESWQIAEMGAQGDFILSDVEPYITENFPDYKCHDAEFNLTGAMVHVFCKCEQFFPDVIDDAVAADRLELNPVNMGDSEILMPTFLLELYEHNPIKNKKTPVAFFKEQLLQTLYDIETTRKPIKIVTDEEIPLSVESNKGIPCGSEYDDADWRLRMNPIQIFNDALLAWEDFHNDGFILSFGMYFNELITRDFINVPPVSNQFLLIGVGASTLAYRFISHLTTFFQKENLSTLLRAKNTKAGKMPLPRDTVEKTQKEDDIYKWFVGLEWVYAFQDESEPECVVSHVYSVWYKERLVEIVVIYPEKLTEFYFGKYTWRQIWSDRLSVKKYKNAPPEVRLRRPGLKPPTFQLEAVLHLGDKPFEKEVVYRTLWLAAGHIITKVEKMSDSGNVSLVITYHADDVPLFLNRVKDIHQKIVCKMLTKVLGVYVA